jgi:hypothetical protein
MDRHCEQSLALRGNPVIKFKKYAQKYAKSIVFKNWIATLRAKLSFAMTGFLKY